MFTITWSNEQKPLEGVVHHETGKDPIKLFLKTHWVENATTDEARAEQVALEQSSVAV